MFRVKGILLFCASVVFFGCAPQPQFNQEKIDQALALSPSKSGVKEYRIGIADEVALDVWRNPDLSVNVPVRPDGKISVPLIGDVQASGRTPEQLASAVERMLGKYLKDPQVSVVLTSMASHEFIDRVRVTGAVNNAASEPYREGMTVMDMVLSAGGVNDFAAPNNTVMYRKLGNETVAIPVRLNDIMLRGDITTNYPLMPGDIITVPERTF